MYILILLILMTVATGASLAWLYHEQKKQAELQAAEVNAKFETIDSTMRKKLSLTTDYVAGVEKLVKNTSSSIRALDDRAMGMVQGAHTQAVTDISAVSTNVDKDITRLRNDMQTSIIDVNASTQKAIAEPRAEMRVKNTYTNLIDMGEGDNTREVNAGKIGYKKWSDSLDVVGAGQRGGSRSVRVWDKLQTGDVISNNTFTNLIDMGDGDKTREINAGKIGYKTFSDSLDVVGAGQQYGSRSVRVWDKLQTGDVISNNTFTNLVDMGNGDKTRDIHAGKIAYKKWSDSLDVVGAGQTGGSRSVRVWDRLLTDSLCLGDTCMSQADLKRILSQAPPTK